MTASSEGSEFATPRILQTPRQEFIYFLQPNVGGPVKIGCSYTPRDRLCALSAWSPYPLVMLAYAPGDRAVEMTLHGRFSAQRVHSEWFWPSRELLELVAEINRTGVVPGAEAGADMSWHSRSRFTSALPKILALLGCSDKQFADALGVTRATVHIWRGSGISSRSVGKAIAFAKARGHELTARDFFEALKHAA